MKYCIPVIKVDSLNYFKNRASIPFIRKKITDYCRIIRAPKKLVHFAVLEHSTHLGDPHIEIDDSAYHFIVCERGKETFRRTTTDLNELLYWIMSDITASMASRFAASNRSRNKDFYYRRQKEIDQGISSWSLS